MYLFIILVFSLLTALCNPFTVKAAEDQNNVIRVGYYENEVFEEGALEGAIKKGYAYEYYRKLSEYTGWTYEYVYGDFSDIYQMLLDGEVDLVAGLAYTQEREELILYPDLPMGAECYGLVKHTDDNSVIYGPKALAGRTIGVLESAIVDVLKDYLDENHVVAKVVPYKNYDNLLGAFDRKEVDILAAEYDGTYDRNHAEILFSFGETDYYLAVNRNKPELLAKLNEAQSQLISEEPDYISTLRAKYYPVSLSSRAFSVQEKNWLNRHNTLTVGYLNDYLPYSDSDDKGNPNGIVKDIFPAIFKDLGINDIELRYVAYDNYSDLTKAVVSHDIDVAFPVGGGLFFTEEDGIYQSNPVVSAITNLIYKSEYGGVSKYDFAVNENNRMQYYYVKAHYPSYSIKMYSSIEECLEAVMNGEVKCTTLNGLRTNDILRNIKYDGLSFRQLQYNDDRCFGIKIGNEGLLKLLNRGINVMGQEYVINLASSYSDELYTFTFKDFIKRNFLILMLVVTVVVFVIIYLYIQDRRQYHKRLNEKEQARFVLEKINHDKSVYIKNLSHDMRIPLNAINGLVDLIQHTDDENMKKEYLEYVSRYNNQLLGLVNDVLDFSSLESGKAVLEEQKTNIQVVVNEVRAVLSGSVAEKQHIVTVNYKNIRHPNVYTDKIRLSQAILNVLNNAVSFTPPQGLIDISVEEIAGNSANEAGYEFRIKDNGIGMSPEVQASLFDPYRLEKDSLENGSKIQGLGLAITKKIVDMMKGEIFIYSEVGQGTECVIRLPMKIVNDGSPDSDVDREHNLDSYNFIGKRILLVEDVPPGQMIAGKLLKKAGFEIQIATNSSEAFEKMKAAPSGYFDVIILDELPFENAGLEAIKSIRGLLDTQKAQVPIIAIFGKEQTDMERRADEAGINRILYRPVDITQIIDTVGSIIK